jgi:predicted phosphodiesterase
MLKRILVLSDSHGINNLMIRIIEKEAADLVIHAGDYCVSTNVMQKYFHYFVDGNNDYDGKPAEIFVFANFKFLLIHGDRY